MAKNYNISSKSDMRRFERDLKNEVLSEAKKQVHNLKHNVECPHCKKTVSVPSGKSFCPYCRNEIDLQLNVNF